MVCSMQKGAYTVIVCILGNMKKVMEEQIRVINDELIYNTDVEIVKWSINGNITLKCTNDLSWCGCSYIRFENVEYVSCPFIMHDVKLYVIPYIEAQDLIKRSDSVDWIGMTIFLLEERFLNKKKKHYIVAERVKHTACEALD